MAGDIFPIDRERGLAARDWLDGQFTPWVVQAPVKQAIVIGGNHDFLFESMLGQWAPNLPWIYLQDEGVEIGGVKFWGTPWTVMDGWAFNCSTTDEMWGKYSLVPEGTDVVISHGPPWQHLDGGYHMGSPAVNSMLDVIQPRLLICGHCHEAHGRKQYGSTWVYNVSHLDLTYKPAFHPTVIDLERERAARRPPDVHA